MGVDGGIVSTGGGIVATGVGVIVGVGEPEGVADPDGRGAVPGEPDGEGATPRPEAQPSTSCGMSSVSRSMTSFAGVFGPAGSPVRRSMRSTRQSGCA